MKPKWYFSVYGSGLGHISRSLWLADRLPGDKLFSTWGEALELARRSYKALPSLPLDVVWTDEGRMSFKKSLKEFYKTYPTLTLQILQELKNISTISPDIIVSDSRISPLIASRLKGRPSVLIINQANILLPIRENTGIRIIERAFGEMFGFLWDMANTILVPDLPPPYTISEAGIRSGVIRKRGVFAGFFSDPPGPQRFNVRERFGLGKRLIYIGISGPEPTRRFIIEKVLRASELLPADYSVVISKGYAGKDGGPVKFSKGIIFEWDPYRNEFMSQSDVIVSRAGLTTIGESLMRGKPMVLIPISLHGEQQENASKATALGLGMALDQYKATPNDIADTIVKVAEDEDMKRRAERIMKVALSIRAEEMVKDALKGYL